jgi:peroxiredoxin Q/BCP
MTLNVGDKISEISASNQQGEKLTLTFNNPTIVYFYPRDDTPGCTTEATQFNESLSQYEDIGAEVYGVSTDSVDSHLSFCNKYNLEFNLLADSSGEVANHFGLDVSNGKAARTTFIVSEGVIQAVYNDVKPDGHSSAVLSKLNKILEK